MEELNYCHQLELKKKDSTIEKVKLTKSNDVQKFFRKIFDEDSLEIYESFMAVFLNQKMETVGWFKVSQGGISATVVDNKLIFSAALLCHASYIIVAHNHPSGSLEPSQGDIQSTNKIKECARLLDMKLIDHIILTKDDYYSFSDNHNI